MTRFLELVAFVGSVGMVRIVGMPSPARWENLTAVAGWIIIVAWASRLMRGGSEPTLVAASGLLEAAADLLDRLLNLRGWNRIYPLVFLLDLASGALIVAGFCVLFVRHRKNK